MGPPPASSFDQEPSGNTLFGVPQIDEVDDLTADPVFGSPAPTSKPKPPAVSPSFSGPPPVGGLDDEAPGGSPFDAPGVAEFDADSFGGGDALELDLPGAPSTGSKPSVPAPPPSDLDLPAPSRGGAGLSMPPGRDKQSDQRRSHKPRRAPGVPPPPPPAFQGDLDLPAPSDKGQSSDLDLPAPVDLDLPAPAEFDLPQAPHDGLDLPTPVDLDLLEPVGQDVRPVGQDVRPAGMQVRPAGQELEPASQEVRPSGMDVQPADEGIAPRDMGLLEPRRKGEAPAARASADVSPQLSDEPISPRRSPTPKAIAKPAVSRGVLYGAAALLVVGGLGAGVLYSGILDGAPADEGEGKRGVAAPTEAPSKGELAERSGEILAKFKADTPTSYQEATELAQQGGDVIGQAEAALLMDLRYGPDPVLRAQGSKVVEPHAKHEAAHVRRVVGLSKLAVGDLSGAASVLGAEDDLRTRLYRGYVRLAQGKTDGALADAKAVLDVDPGDLAAVHLRHAAELEQDPQVARKAIAKSLESHPEHPGLQELAIEAGMASGYLAEATEAAKKLQPPEDASANYRARILTLQGRLAAARGDYPRAIKRLEEALNIAPKTEATQLALTRTLLQAGELLEAGRMIRSTVEAHPDSVDANLLRVETLVASGDGDEALALAQELGKRLPDRPEPPFLEGKVQAMRLQLDEGAAAFARALEKDPSFHRAHIAHAKMLADGRELDEAVEKLTAAIQSAREDDGASLEAIADMLVQRARLQVKQDQVRAAITALDEALQTVPTHNEAQTLRGVLSLQAGDLEKGQEDLQAVYERTDGYPGMTAPLGRLLARQGRVEELQALVGDQASESRASNELKLVGARLALLQDDVEQAKTLADEVLVREPNNWEAQLLMAEAFRASGDFAEALEKIEDVRPPTPRAEVHFYRGRILEFNYQSDKARGEYQRALALDPQLHEARFLYGRLLAYQGLAKQALGELDQVIAATGEQFPMAYMARGIARRELGQHQEAIEDHDKALELDPNLAEAHYWKGRSLFTLNRDKAAAAAYLAATEAEIPGGSTPDWYLGALVGLGESRIQIGQSAAAKAPLQKYLDLAPADHPQRSTAERKLAEVK